MRHRVIFQNIMFKEVLFISSTDIFYGKAMMSFAETAAGENTGYHKKRFFG